MTTTPSPSSTSTVSAVPTPTAKTTRLTSADEKAQPATDISSTPTQSSNTQVGTSQTKGTNVNVTA